MGLCRWRGKSCRREAPLSAAKRAAGRYDGTTGSQDPGDYGTVFSITKTGLFSVIHSFSNTGDGAQPTGNLVRDSAGVIYGGTAYGPAFKIKP